MTVRLLLCLGTSPEPGAKKVVSSCRLLGAITDAHRGEMQEACAGVLHSAASIVAVKCVFCSVSCCPLGAEWALQLKACAHECWLLVSTDWCLPEGYVTWSGLFKFAVQDWTAWSQRQDCQHNLMC